MDSQQQEGGSGSTCDTLSVSCYKALTKTPINSAQLQELPQHLLVQLLEKAAAERDAAEEIAKAQAAELLELKQREEQRYLVEPPCCGSRVDREAWGPRITSVLAKWEPCTSRAEFTAEHNAEHCLKIGSRNLVYHKQPRKCFAFVTTTDVTTAFANVMHGHGENTARMDEIMSSALLLYRLCCLFHGMHVNVYGRQGYKVCGTQPSGYAHFGSPVL